MRQKILQTIARIPRGKVSTYGAVAAAAGFSGRARLVARALHGSPGVPWQRVLGSGGAIKLQGEHALEQRFRLQGEGVGFRGKKVDMKQYEHRWNKTRAR
jgi:methylated-DNA-protein-cysteine methyltransferase-like protein